MLRRIKELMHFLYNPPFSNFRKKREIGKTFGRLLPTKCLTKAEVHQSEYTRLSVKEIPVPMECQFKPFSYFECKIQLERKDGLWYVFNETGKFLDNFNHCREAMRYVYEIPFERSLRFDDKVVL